MPTDSLLRDECGRCHVQRECAEMCRTILHEAGGGPEDSRAASGIALHSMRLNPINVAFRPYRRRTGVAKPLKASSTDFVIFSETYVFFVTSLSAGAGRSGPDPGACRSPRRGDGVGGVGWKSLQRVKESSLNSFIIHPLLEHQNAASAHLLAATGAAAGGATAGRWTPHGAEERDGRKGSEGGNRRKEERGRKEE